MKIFRCSLTLLFILGFFVISLKDISASSIIFQDDFTSDLNKWIPTRDDGSKWVIKNGMAGAKVQNNFEVTEIIPSDSFLQQTTDKFSVEFDVLPISGSDVNFTLQFASISNFYEIHFVPNNLYLDRTQPTHSSNVSYNLPYNVLSHIKIDYKETSINVFVDNTQIVSLSDLDNPYRNGKIGLKVGTGLGGATEVYFDNIVVTSIDPTPTVEPTPEPTALPTSTPDPTPVSTPTPVVTPTPDPTVVPTPSPTPVPTTTPFLYFSQKDPAWGKKPFDSAKSWASNGKYLFEDWGCAVTSAAMILRHHGISQLPNGQGTTPGSLHDWLVTQKAGFINGGNLNWEKIAEASRLMHITHPLWPKLEYKRADTTDMDELAGQLTTGKPTILKEPGHFIVAHTFNDADNIEIADPYYTSKTKLSDYAGKFLSLRKFTPSFTDLSYIMYYGDENVTPTLFKKDGKTYQPVTNASVFIEDQLIDPEDGTPSGVGNTSSLEYAKPGDGNYRLSLQRNDPGISAYTLLLYDKNAAEKFLKEQLFFGTTPVTIDITFSNGDITRSKIHRQLTFADLKRYLHLLKTHKKYRHGYQGQDLSTLLSLCESFYKHHPRISKQLYDLFLHSFHQRRSFMETQTAETIEADIKLARTQLFP
ncbi:C39 family peptidase [Candidatus Woesebacteria bacterium]|nr:C39 family peptidase [Candidatus Woesebacteria bacterium]